jgi:hypothetical protein
MKALAADDRVSSCWTANGVIKYKLADSQEVRRVSNVLDTVDTILSEFFKPFIFLFILFYQIAASIVFYFFSLSITTHSFVLNRIIYVVLHNVFMQCPSVTVCVTIYYLTTLIYLFYLLYLSSDWNFCSH